MSNVRVIPVESDWRVAGADALEAEALVFDHALEALANVEAILEASRASAGRLTDLRTAAASLRSERNDRVDRVGELRAALRNDARVSA